MMSFIKLIYLFSLILSLKCHLIYTTNAVNKHYSGESKQVLEILNDMQSDASHHNPYLHYGRHSGPPSHEGHNSGHNHWDNNDKLWETGAGAQNSDFDKYGNQGYKQHYYDIGDGYHDRHNDGLRSGNFEGYDDRSLWSRDRGQDHERNMKWDRELEKFATFVRNVVKKANAGKAGHLSKYHNLDNGAHYGLKHIDDSNYNIYGGRGRHSGHGWHELDRYSANKGQLIHGSGYRDNHYPIPHIFH